MTSEDEVKAINECIELVDKAYTDRPPLEISLEALEESARLLNGSSWQTKGQLSEYLYNLATFLEFWILLEVHKKDGAKVTLHEVLSDDVKISIENYGRCLREGLYTMDFILELVRNVMDVPEAESFEELAEDYLDHLDEIDELYFL